MVTALLIVAILAIVLVSGVATKAILSPAGHWFDTSTLPLGFALLITLSVPALVIMPGDVAGPVIAVVVALLLALGVVRRLHAGVGTARSVLVAVRPSAATALPLAIGLIGAAAYMVPVFRDGAAGIVSISNNDGWYYAAVIEWLGSHRLNAPLSSVIAEPLGAAVGNLRFNNLPTGFESMAAAINGVFRRPAYGIVMPIAAISLPVAACGWAWLAGLLTRSMDRGVAAVASLAIASPLFLLAFSEAYVNQVVGLALVPGVVAAGLALSRNPGVVALLTAALMAAALVGVYPSLIPWVALPMAAVMVWRPDAGHRFLPWSMSDGVLRRAGRALVLMCALGAAVAIIAPLQLVRAVSFITSAAGFSGTAGFIAYTPRQYVLFAIGAKSGPPVPMTALVTVSGILIAAALVITVVMARRVAPVRRALVIVAALALAGFVVWFRYGQLDYAYGVYKSVISTGVLLGGAIMVAVACWVPVRRAAAVAVATVVVFAWAPSARAFIAASEVTISGFRSADFALIERIGGLPKGSVTLVEGAASNWDIQLFQSRMIGAFAEHESGEVDLEGLGSTYSYISPGPMPEWRPQRPWNYVVQTRSSPFDRARSSVWATGTYSLKRSPVLDVSPYGDAWYNVEFDGARPVQWTSGPAEILMSNSGTQPRSAVLAVTVTTAGVARRAVLESAGSRAAAPVAIGGRSTLRIAVRIPARRVVSAILSSVPGGLPVPPDVRGLALRVESVRLSAEAEPARGPGRVSP
jgi:hypothetical protein